MTNYQYFEIIANTAILAVEEALAGILVLRGIDRSQWPKPWPLVGNNPHGTLDPSVVRVAMALVVEDGKESFVAGWKEWLARCSTPLNTPESVDEMISSESRREL